MHNGVRHEHGNIEARSLSADEIHAVLMQKINEENQLIAEDAADEHMMQRIEYRHDAINVVSLFSGAGGLDLGVELAGVAAVQGLSAAMQAFQAGRANYDALRHKGIFHTIYTNDMFPEANETYRSNFDTTIVQHHKDIRKVAHFPMNELMIGGFPCPGFSEAGPRLIDDKRNFLYLHFIRALIETQPLFFVAENVKGMMTLGKGQVLQQIIEDFASAGYTVTAHLVNARDYGVPQLRERVFLIGVHTERIEKTCGFHYTLPAPSHGDAREIDLLAPQVKPWVTLRQAIGDLSHDYGEVFEGGYSSIYMSRNRKKSWNEQSFTIQASGRQTPQHPSGEPMEKIGANQWVFHGEHRRLSAREIQRIQTFPDWFTFSKGASLGANGKKLSEQARLDKVYRQIGNAVPVLLARAMVQPIADFLAQHVELRGSAAKLLL